MAWWKSITTLFNASKNNRGFRIDLAGDGPQKMKLQNMAKKFGLSDVHFMGYQKNSDIPAIMANHDVLVLPSIYDGWGAVVNEALMSGLYVICSDKCGAKDLILNDRLGKVFKGGSVTELSSCLQYVSDNVETIRKDWAYRHGWASKHISGEAISKYMVNILMNREVTPPWKET